MKKLLSILMVIIMMLSIIVVPAYAEIIDTENFRYYDEFSEYYGWAPDPYYYKEIYYYFEQESDEEPTWTLIQKEVNIDFWPRIFGVNVGNRMLVTYNDPYKSVSGYYVYIKEMNTFLPVQESEIDKIIDYCPDFVKVIEENEIGELIGDINRNNVLDITDVTQIQRYIAGYTNYDKIDDQPKELYYKIFVNGCRIDMSDFDRDGETTIMDATKIQRHIAGLE